MFDSPKSDRKTDIFGTPISSTSNQKKEPDEISKAITEMIHELAVVSAMGVSDYLRLLWRHWYITIPLTVGSYYLCQYIVDNLYHLKLLHYSEPEIFTIKRLKWLYKFSYSQHVWTIFSLSSFFVCVVLGIRIRFIRTKYKNIFESAGLTSRTGKSPILLHKKRLDKNRVALEFKANGVSLKSFQDRIGELEANFERNVESIRHGKTQARVIITLSKEKLPSKVTLNEVVQMKMLPDDSFYLGLSMEGVITQKISELPHMLIAGATGCGKSIFFKQALMGLLESVYHLQMYLIDLKGGLEMIDFSPAPNIKVYKTMQDAVILLRNIKREMEDRFSYLEKNKLKQIDPERDKKERIIVAVDESSILYVSRSKFDPDYKYAIEARSLANSISKLSRAAAIHLMLATQKLDSEVLPTSVSENISGRMAFKANSLMGSMIVLGNKGAYELPEIRGRGIWNYGSENIMVQAPYVSETEIQNYAKTIKNEFAAGKRKLFNLMIGIKEQEESMEEQIQFIKNEKRGD